MRQTTNRTARAVVAVGADRDGIAGLERARRAGVPAFVERVGDHPTREAWDEALADGSPSTSRTWWSRRAS